MERLHCNLTQGWVLFWRTVLAFTFYLNWLCFLFQNKIITQAGILTLGSPLWHRSFLLFISSLRTTLTAGVSQTHASLVFTLKLCLTLPGNTAQPWPQFGYHAKSSLGLFPEGGRTRSSPSRLIYILLLPSLVFTLLASSCGVLCLILLPVSFLSSSAKPRASSVSSVRMRMTSSFPLSSISAGPVKVRAGARWGGQTRQNTRLIYFPSATPISKSLVWFSSSLCFPTGAPSRGVRRVTAATCFQFEIIQIVLFSLPFPT